MQEAAVIQFRNRNSPACITDALQLDLSAQMPHLTACLNTLLATETEYIFYYENCRLTSDIRSVIEKYALDTEHAIVIDYMDTRQQEADLNEPFDDVVTGLCCHKGRLYASTYSGRLYSVAEDAFGQAESGKRPEATVDVRMIVGDLRIYAATEDSVVDLETGQAMASQLDSKIACLATHGDSIALGMEDKRILLIFADEEAATSGDTRIIDMVPTNSFFRSIALAEDALYWVESLNVIFRYDLETKSKQHHSAELTITSIRVEKDVIYAATSNSKLVVVANGSLSVHDVSTRLVDKILVGNGILLLVAQYSIAVLDQKTLEEKTCLFFDEQVNASVLGSDKLFVASGSSISAFFLTRFA